MGTEGGAWTVLTVALVVAVALLDIVVGSTGFSGLLVVGPVVASFRLTPRRTALVAVLAVVAGLAAALAGDRLGSLNETIRVVGIGVVGGVCVLGAAWHERRERAFQQVTRVAEVAQLAILRPIPSRVGPVALASRYLSAAEQAFIGGDLYDVVPTREGARAVIGDVRGKGLDAVQLAATVLAAFREAAVAEETLAQVAEAVDRAVAAEISLEDFVTAVFVEFGRHGRFEMVNCGHHLPLRVSGGSVDHLGSGLPEPPLGLAPEFRPELYHLGRGDRLLLFTDGLVEARAPDGSFFPLEQRAPSTLTRRGLQAAVDDLINEALGHAGGRLDDDLAVLLAEVRA